MLPVQARHIQRNWDCQLVDIVGGVGRSRVEQEDLARLPVGLFVVIDQPLVVSRTPPSRRCRC